MNTNSPLESVHDALDRGETPDLNSAETRTAAEELLAIERALPNAVAETTPVPPKRLHENIMHAVRAEHAAQTHEAKAPVRWIAWSLAAAVLLALMVGVLFQHQVETKQRKIVAGILENPPLPSLTIPRSETTSGNPDPAKALNEIRSTANSMAAMLRTLDRVPRNIWHGKPTDKTQPDLEITPTYEQHPQVEG